MCVGCARARSTHAGSAYVIKPNPRERLEIGSFITTASVTGPYAAKYERSFSAVTMQNTSNNPTVRSYPPSFTLVVCVRERERSHEGGISPSVVSYESPPMKIFLPSSPRAATRASSASSPFSPDSTSYILRSTNPPELGRRVRHGCARRRGPGAVGSARARRSCSRRATVALREKARCCLPLVRAVGSSVGQSVASQVRAGE